jgi:3-oxoacyl-[acyl-carrier protein] reductase
LKVGMRSSAGVPKALAVPRRNDLRWPVPALDQTLASLATPCAQAHRAIALDFSEPHRFEAALSAYLTQSPAQILLNNTGGPPGGALIDATPSAFTTTFAQHLLAGHALVQLVLPGMRAARYGRVINVISTSVKEPIRGLGVSNTIRGAVASWAKTLAGELGADGITVNNVLPGYTRTDRLESIIEARSATASREAVEAAMRQSIPLARFAEPDEIAAAIEFLASPAAGYINGINLPVDGGRTLSL